MDFYGIDPGKKGGIAKLDGRGELVDVWPMPLREDGRVEIRQVGSYLFKGQPKGSAHYAIERAQAMPKQGIVSTARYLEDFGKIVGILEIFAGGNQAEFLHFPRPQMWKQILERGTNKAAAAHLVRKVYGAEVIKRLTPKRGQHPHDGQTEAICIALWAYRRYSQL